jgi:peptide chain release factor 2
LKLWLLHIKVEDAKAIVELLEEDTEARDAGLLQEAADIVRWLGNALDRYEMTKLLSGQYDKKGARLSISAGAGGTDAQVLFSLFSVTLFHYRLFPKS